MSLGEMKEKGRMMMWTRAKMVNWCPAVVVLVLLGLPGASLAEPVNPGEEARSSDDDSEEIAVMDETVVTGSFEDPFEDPFAVEESEPVHDPWEPFNAKMFELNYNLDRHVLKPGAQVYDAVIPEDVQDSLGNAFYNLGFPARLFNNLVQGKFDGAGKETQRFLLNSTLGVGGLFDVATHMFEIEAPPEEDVGQTLAVHGVPSGPYLVLPLFPPTTVRDAAAELGDIFLNPVNYFVPFFPNLGMNATEMLNTRARNLKTLEGIEESSVDLYGAARSGYFDRRAHDIQE